MHDVDVNSGYVKKHTTEVKHQRAPFYLCQTAESVLMSHHIPDPLTCLYISHQVSPHACPIEIIFPVVDFMEHTKRDEKYFCLLYVTVFKQMFLMIQYKRLVNFLNCYGMSNPLKSQK